MLHTRPPVNNTLCTKNNQITDSYTGKHTCGDLNVQTQAMTEGLEIYFRRFYYHMNWSLYHIGCWNVFSGMQLWDKTGRGGADTGICKQITVWLHVLLSAFLMHISLICNKMSIIFFPNALPLLSLSLSTSNLPLIGRESVESCVLKIVFDFFLWLANM